MLFTKYRITLITYSCLQKQAQTWVGKLYNVAPERSLSWKDRTRMDAKGISLPKKLHMLTHVWSLTGCAISDRGKLLVLILPWMHVWQYLRFGLIVGESPLMRTLTPRGKSTLPKASQGCLSGLNPAWESCIGLRPYLPIGASFQWISWRMCNAVMNMHEGFHLL